MKKLHVFSAGIFAACLMVIAAFLGQIFTSTHAANTLVGTNSQIITIATTDGLPPDNGASYAGSSSDGNVILFSSSSTNLPNAGSSVTGWYTYNIKTNTTARVDVSTSGVAANDNPYTTNGVPARISETGRYVTFISKATNLIDGTTGLSNYYTIVKRDMQANITTLLSSREISGYPANYDRNLAVSNDGRFVLLASRYLAGSYPYYYTTALGDEATGTYGWTSLGYGNVIEGGSGSDNTRASMSCDGSFVVNNLSNQVNLIDMRRGTKIVVDYTGSNSGSPLISCNGRYVLYATTNRTKITPTPSGMNTGLHLARYDRISGERMYIDSNSSGVFSNGFAWNSSNEPAENVFNASISDLGDVVFKFGNGGNMFLKHLSDGSGTLESIALTTSGTYINSTNGEITRNGNYIFFSMDPYNLGLTSSPSSSQIIRVKTNL